MAELNYDAPNVQRFNSSLDEQGPIEIAGFSQMPSRILFEMDPVAYKEAFDEFKEADYEQLKEIVFEDYPSIVAYNFRLSEKGPGANDPVRKLLHLKDTWESVVFVLYALILGEVRAKGSFLTGCQVFVSLGAGGNPLYATFNSDKIFSEAVKQKIQNIKAIVKFSRVNDLGFKCEAISDELLDLLMKLQDVRNDISHHAAPTKEQAEMELRQVLPLFKDMLLETRFLEDCKIFRFDSFSTDFRCESYNGHHLNKEFTSFLPETEETRRYLLALGTEQLFVKWEENCFSLSPFLHFVNDGTGHESFICFYKKKRNGSFWYEPLKIREEKEFPYLQNRFNQEKQSLLNLIVPEL